MIQSAQSTKQLLTWPPLCIWTVGHVQRLAATTGVARAIDRHSEETAQSGSGVLNIGPEASPPTTRRSCSSLAKARMKIVLRNSKGSEWICGLMRERAVRDLVMGPSC